jgi:Cysteine rich repeat
MLKSILAIAATLLLLGSSVVAQERARACVADIKKLCAGVEPGGGRVVGCFKEHLSELSPTCQDLVAEAATAAQACTADIRQQCADARNRIAQVACIKSALAKLTEDCKTAVSQVATEQN